jgi:cytochrome c-type biogenesis protein CcmH/NrfF
MEPFIRDEEAILCLEQEVMAMEQAMEALYVQAAKSLLQQAEQTSKKANSLTDALIRKKSQLSRLRGDIRCPACQTVNLYNSRFCSFCGKKLM